MKQDTNTIGIIGGGLAGLTLAALLGQEGFNVVCVDAAPLAQQISGTYDGRTTAISYGSRQVMERAGVWGELAGKSAAIETIDILDGDSDAVLNFAARETGAEAFGWIVDNADLRRQLLARVQGLKTVKHVTGVQVQDVTFGADAATIVLDDGRRIDVRLVVGADGRKSILRDIMGVGAWGREYGQTAVVCLVAHDKPHHGMAVEHFMPEGPFALLPFTDLPDGTHRSALVWTVHGPDAKAWVKCDEDVFNAALQERSRGRYGRIHAAGRREAWPLTLVKSYSYISPRAVLVAEAAHGMHPIAGQGLNMSLRDLDALTDLLVQAREDGRDVGAMDVLEAYQSRRRGDNLAMSLATDGLTMLFSNDFAPVRMARRFGLRAVARLPFAKQFFMRQAMGLKAFSKRASKPVAAKAKRAR